MVILLVVLGLSGAGCNSIYRQTRATLRPEPDAQLEFRIAEAQAAEKFAGQALAKLRERLDRGLSGEAVEPDVDRLEVSALELERQVASARDAAARCAEPTQAAQEIERLAGRARELLEQVQVVRRGGNSANARQLDDSLQGSAKP